MKPPVSQADQATSQIPLSNLQLLNEPVEISSTISENINHEEKEVNKDEAREVLRNRLQEYRQKSYSDLMELVNENRQDCYEVTAPSGTWYQLEIQFFWDDKPNGDIRVIGAVDDGGLSAFKPLCLDFIKAPDDSFVGE